MEQNLTLRVEAPPEQWLVRPPQPAAQTTGSLLEQLAGADTAARVIVLVAAQPPSTMHTEDIVVACRRISLRWRSINDVLVRDFRFEKFMTAAKEVVQTDDLEPRQVASLLWSISSLDKALPELQELLPAVCRAVPAAAPGMNPRNLTASFSAVTKLSRAVPEVLASAEALLSQIIAEADSLEPSQVSMVIRSAGQLDLSEEQVYSLTDALLSDLTFDDVSRFKIPELANLVWGLADVGERDEGLLRAVARAVANSAARLRHREVTLDLPMLICGLQRLMYRDEEFLRTVAADALLNRTVIRKFKGWGLCALAWAWPDVWDGNLANELRRVREAINGVLAKRKMTQDDVERSILGPGRWMRDLEERSVRELEEREESERP